VKSKDGGDLALALALGVASKWVNQLREKSTINPKVEFIKDKDDRIDVDGAESGVCGWDGMAF
jgi:hypothetical protein